MGEAAGLEGWWVAAAATGADVGAGGELGNGEGDAPLLLGLRRGGLLEAGEALRGLACGEGGGAGVGLGLCPLALLGLGALGLEGPGADSSPRFGHRLPSFLPSVAYLGLGQGL